MSTTNVVVVQGQQDPISVGFIPVLLLVGFLGLVITHFWYILAVAVVMFGCLALWRVESRTRRQQHALAARADHQNRLALEGDPRGVYGDVQGSLQ